MKGKRNRSWVGLSAPRWRAPHVVRNGEGAVMKQFMRALLCLCLLLPLGAKAEEFSNVFVFGDSLSDTGNLAAFADAQAFLLTGDPTKRVALCFPGVTFNPDGTVKVDPDFPCDDLFFMNSRVSNGPVAVEVLAERLGFDDFQPSLHPLPLLGLPRPFVGTNYAVAGAHARVRIDPKTGNPEPEDLGAQIFAFLQLDHGGVAPSEALYVVMIGGNDVIDAVQALLDPSEDPRAISAAAVDAIGDNINLLIGAGARKFLVANSPNIGSIPAIKIAAEEAGVPPVLVRGVATFVTIKFNRRLAERLVRSRRTNR